MLSPLEPCLSMHFVPSGTLSVHALQNKLVVLKLYYSTTLL